jgi:integrase
MPRRDFADFLAGLKSRETARNYAYGIKWVLGTNPDNFILFAKRKKRKAEDLLIDFIRGKRGKVASDTIVNPIRAVKSFADYSEVDLNWKVVLRELPKAKKVANDRRPRIEEIRAFLNHADLRMQTAILMQSSGGFRVGAWDWLRMRDITFQDNGIARVVIYRGEPEEYVTFISKEAVDKLKEYIAFRERAGEKIGPDSPVLRDEWNTANKGDATKPKPMNAKNVRNTMGRIWIKAGVRSPTGSGGRKRQEFQQSHALRKHFETQAARGIMQPLAIEALKGKANSYYKQHPEELEEEYMKAHPHLLISEKYTLTNQLQRQESEHKSVWNETRLELLEEKAKRQELEAKLKALEERPRMSREEIRKMFEEEFMRMNQKAAAQSRQS